MIAYSALSQNIEPATTLPVTNREFAEVIYRLNLCKQQSEVRMQVIQRQNQEITIIKSQNTQLKIDNMSLTKKINNQTEALNRTKRNRWLYIAGGAIGGIIMFAIITK